MSHRAGDGGAAPRPPAALPAPPPRLLLTLLAAAPLHVFAVPTAGDWSARPDATLASMPATADRITSDTTRIDGAAPSGRTVATTAGAVADRPTTTTSPTPTGSPPSTGLDGKSADALDAARANAQPAASAAVSTPVPLAPSVAVTALGASVPGDGVGHIQMSAPTSETAQVPLVVPGASIAAFGVGSVLRTLAGLAAVLLAVLACGWLARRLNTRGVASGRLARVVGGVSLGNRERVAVVEIAGTWLVLGVTPGRVTTLHTLPADAGVDALRTVTTRADSARPAPRGDDAGPSLDRGADMADAQAAGRAPAPAASERTLPNFGEALRAQILDRLRRRRNDA